eukprot:CAMPEP_0202836410 /NCGR_PEP_ID=MMETSP1389-20130828/41255_1 /ASSEMBLY_ACC=CAM_ASM_000865 /TAXON_ID=302021 /ORGANISM="Rhodomonas sp., Strain CCMP768" /LENGTH=109 /DNA_ID=CAMNT_0049512201 /DNA_START=13 /DNA_END=342 /DNA_ORIENTATION=+
MARSQSLVQLYFFEELSIAAGVPEARSWLEQERKKSENGPKRSCSPQRRFVMRPPSPTVRSPSSNSGTEKLSSSSSSSSSRGRKFSVENDERIGLMFTDAAHLLETADE